MPNKTTWILETCALREFSNSSSSNIHFFWKMTLQARERESHSPHSRLRFLETAGFSPVFPLERGESRFPPRGIQVGGGGRSVRLLFPEADESEPWDENESLSLCHGVEGSEISHFFNANFWATLINLNTPSQPLSTMNSIRLPNGWKNLVRAIFIKLKGLRKASKTWSASSVSWECDCKDPTIRELAVTETSVQRNKIRHESVLI